LAKKKQAYVDFEDYWIKVEGVEIEALASINVNLKIDRPSFYDENDPAFEFETRIDITGQCYYPERSADSRFSLKLIGDSRERSSVSAIIKDFHELDERYSPIYKIYRGERYPVFRTPFGFSTIKKKRGENAYDSWLWVKPRMVSDILSLYGLNRPLFACITIRKHGRDKWIERLSIQTRDLSAAE